MKVLKVCLGLLLLTSCGKEDIIEKKEPSHNEERSILSQEQSEQLPIDEGTIESVTTDKEEKSTSSQDQTSSKEEIAEDVPVVNEEVEVAQEETLYNEESSKNIETSDKREDQAKDIDTTEVAKQQVNKLTLLLPINWTTQQHHNLSIIIPDGYRSIQNLDALGEPIANVEFVPQEESDFEWNRIITVTKLTGQSLSAENFVTALKDMMSKQASNVHVLATQVTKEDAFEKASVALSYDYQDKHEVFAAQYFSGPLDLAGVQYTLRPVKEQSDAHALEEIETFFNNHVKVIN